MSNKVVDGIVGVDFRNNPITGKGTLTKDEKIVVSCNIRPAGGSTVAAKNPDIKVKFLARVDASVSLWDGKKQGPHVIPYLSLTVMGTETPTGQSSVFLSSKVDNDNNRVQYKNFLLSDDVNDTLKKEFERATEEYIEKVKNGISIVTVNSTVKHAEDFINLSKKYASQRPARTQPAAVPAVISTVQAALAEEAM